MEKSNFPWITDDLVLKLVKKGYLDQEISIDSWSIKNGAPDGTGFLSTTCRIEVIFTVNKTKTQKIVFFQKSLLNGPEELINFVKTVFEKEIDICEKILPQTDELLKKIQSEIYPRCVAVDEETFSYIIFEDISPLGFKNIDKQNGLDFDHMKLALKKLAQWHALSAEIISHGGSELEKFRCSIVELFPDLNTFIHNLLLALIDAWESSDIDPKIFDKLRALLNVGGEKARESYISNVGGFNVIRHGDCWSNNFMFHYDDSGALKDARIIDFSFVSVGSLAHDIRQLMFISSDEKLREPEWNQLLELYHEELVKVLEKVEYKKPLPTLNTIKHQFSTNGLYIALYSLVELNNRCRGPDHREADSVSLFMSPSLSEEDRKLKAEAISRPAVANITKFLIQFYDKNGYFDL